MITPEVTKPFYQTISVWMCTLVFAKAAQGLRTFGRLIYATSPTDKTHATNTSTSTHNKSITNTN
jgi:hypothetical protein